jgi:hypothetical protein
MYQVNQKTTTIYSLSHTQTPSLPLTRTHTRSLSHTHTCPYISLYDAQPRAKFDADECKKLKEFSDRVTAMIASPLPSLGEQGDCRNKLDSIQARVQVLMKCAAFKMRPVDPLQMMNIAEKARPVVVEQGAIVAKKGEKCDVVWFVAAGSLSCEVDGIQVQKLGAGQSIGEMSFIEVSTLVSGGTPLEAARTTALRTADVVACEHTELLELSFGDAWTVVQKVACMLVTPNVWMSLFCAPERAHTHSHTHTWLLRPRLEGSVCAFCSRKKCAGAHTHTHTLTHTHTHTHRCRTCFTRSRR